jgi:hypothetical protein
VVTRCSGEVRRGMDTETESRGGYESKPARMTRCAIYARHETSLRIPHACTARHCPSLPPRAGYRKCTRRRPRVQTSMRTTMRRSAGYRTTSRQLCAGLCKLANALWPQRRGPTRLRDPSYTSWCVSRLIQSEN